MLNPKPFIAGALIVVGLIVTGGVDVAAVGGEDGPQVDTTTTRTQVGPEVVLDEDGGPSKGERLTASVATGSPPTSDDAVSRSTSDAVPGGFVEAARTERIDQVPGEDRLIRSTELEYINADGEILWVIWQDATSVEKQTLRAAFDFIGDTATIVTPEFVQVIRFVDGGIVNVVAEKRFDDPTAQVVVTADQTAAIADAIAADIEADLNQ